MRLRVSHTTCYTYGRAVAFSSNEVRLQPLVDDRQLLQSFKLTIKPDCKVVSFQDFYQNTVHCFELATRHEQLEITSLSEVEVKPDGRVLPAQPVGYQAGEKDNFLDTLYDFMSSSTMIDLSPELQALVGEIIPVPQNYYEDALGIMEWIYRNFRYDQHATSVGTTIPECLEARAGVCQDFAHVMIGLCRCLMIPARYVSGYFWIDKEEHPSALASHAWVEVFLPRFGWLGLDPTHNRREDERYVRLAVGRDYWDVRPVAGAYRGTSESTLTVVVEMDRLA